MKANELRIGNYYKSGQTAPVPKDWSMEEWKSRRSELKFQDNIICLTTEDFKSKGFWSAFNIGWIEGIPLTEDWFEDFVFEKNHNTNGWGKGAVTVLQFSGGWITYFEDVDIITIKYVHQLQNLYFALTGEELQIKVPA